MLREVGRKATFYMLKYVKNNCKGGKMNITVQMYPCSEGTDTGNPVL